MGDNRPSLPLAVSGAFADRAGEVNRGRFVACNAYAQFVVVKLIVLTNGVFADLTMMHLRSIAQAAQRYCQRIEGVALMHQPNVMTTRSECPYRIGFSKPCVRIVFRAVGICLWLSGINSVSAWQLEVPAAQPNAYAPSSEGEVISVPAGDFLGNFERPNGQNTIEASAPPAVDSTWVAPTDLNNGLTDGPLMTPNSGVEDFVNSQPPAPQAEMFGTAKPYWYGYSTPVRVNFYGGESYAEPDSFLSIDLFRPLRNWRFSGGSEQVRYLDARVGFSTMGRAFGNLGLGQRHYFANEDTIVDANVWYDLDDTGNRLFHQVTAGGQIQNRNLLLRAHYYFPFAQTEEVNGYSDTTGTYYFLGNSLAQERYRLEEQAYHGFDAEIGLLLPVNDYMLKWFVGYYNFEAEDAEPIDGVSTTVSAALATSIDLGLQVTYDDESDVGYMATVSYDFYSGNRDPAPTIRHRLGESVRRNRHILRRDIRILDPEVLTDTGGASPNFIHVGPGGNSDGSIESPYATLAQATADATTTANSIIFVHADSVLDGQSIVLPQGTRLLGEGVDHTVTIAGAGTITLPQATTGTATPIIRNSPGTGPAITLADNVEVNNFVIQNAGATGIFGTGLTGGTSVLNTSINGAVQGIHIANSGGALTFDNLSISNTTGTGLQIETSNSGAAFTFNNALTIANTGGHGIYLNRNTESSTTTFAGPVSITNTAGHGIFFDDNADLAATTFNGATTIDTTTGSGVFLSDLDNNAVAGVTTPIKFVGDLSINNTAQSGFEASRNDSNVSVGNLTLTDWDVSAISIADSTSDFTFGSALALNNSNGVLASTIAISNSTGGLTFTDVSITDTSRTGLGQATVSLVNNNTGTDEITFNTLNVTSNNGTALSAQSLSTAAGKLVINGGTINSSDSTAVFLQNLATDITFQSVSASNAAIGINLQDVGAATAFHERFQIVGDSFTAGSGGTLTGVQTGVLVSGTEDVSLHLLNINSTVAGVRSQNSGFNDSEDLTVNRVVFTDGSGTANWVGIDIDWDGGGAHTGNGNALTSNTITGSGTGQTGIQIVNVQSNPAMQNSIGGNTINLTGAASNGLSFSATGIAVGQTTTTGDINLNAGLNNIINATGSPFIVTEATGGEVTGQIQINGVLTSP